MPRAFGPSDAAYAEYDEVERGRVLVPDCAGDDAERPRDADADDDDDAAPYCSARTCASSAHCQSDAALVLIGLVVLYACASRYLPALYQSKSFLLG